jgi:hypothetical protein
MNAGCGFHGSKIFAGPLGLPCPDLIRGQVADVHRRSEHLAAGRGRPGLGAHVREAQLSEPLGAPVHRLLERGTAREPRADHVGEMMEQLGHARGAVEPLVFDLGDDGPIYRLLGGDRRGQG